ncbi:MAG: extracellular solute-binding protein [Aquiluna sp.]|nr:extracellular solute-binding protein [Aquiluna sp.]
MHLLPRSVTLGLVIILVAGLSACSSPSSQESSTEPEIVQADTASSITVWLDQRTAEGAASIADQFVADSGIEVKFRIVSDLVLELQASSEADAIDVLIAPHALQPQLLAGGLIQALPSNLKLERFLAGAASAFNIDGVQYGVPLSHENIALACSSKGLPAAPKTFPELVDAGLVISMNDGGGDPYHLFPIQSSFGAKIFQPAQSGSGEPELVMGSQQGLAFATWLGANAELFDLASNTETAKNQLSAADKACWMTGPWNSAWFDSEFGEDGWNAFPVPAVGPEPAAVFLEVIGAMVSSRSQNFDAAADFVLQYLGSEAGQVAIFNSTGFPPSNLAALEMISNYKVPYQFGMAGMSGSPTPSNAEMDAVWYPWSQAQVGIIAGVDDPEGAWLEMVDQIKSAIN